MKLRNLLNRLRGRKPRPTGWSAICIGPEGWTMARVSRRGTRPRLRIYHAFTDAELLAGRLAGHKRVTTLLDTTGYKMLQLETPNVAPDELRTAIRWQVRQLLDAPADDVTIDVLDIPQASNKLVRPALMLVVAAQNDAVARRIAEFHDIQIPLEVIDIPELALRNVAALFERPGHAVLMAWFDRNHGTLLLVQGGELYLVRHLDSGAQKLIRDSEERDQHLERILREIRRTLDHIERYFRDLSLSHLVLALPCDPEPLAAYLRADLDLPVEVANLNQVLDGITDHIPDPIRQVEALPLIGAALRLEEAAK